MCLPARVTPVRWRLLPPCKDRRGSVPQRPARPNSSLDAGRQWWAFEAALGVRKEARPGNSTEGGLAVGGRAVRESLEGASGGA